MRSRLFVATFLLSAGVTPIVAAEELLCASWENPIADDMQILEADLTHERAEQAFATLRNDKPTSHDMELAYLNSAKIVQGYSLRQVALTLKSDHAISEFCSWLVKDGYWYD